MRRALAAAAVLRGDDAWGARILGARDAITERTGTTVVDKSVHDLRDQAESEVRARLCVLLAAPPVVELPTGAMSRHRGRFRR